MQKIGIENPTRRQIVLLLKKHGGMTTEQLSNALNITPMGIRQHLLALEKKGLVTYEVKKQGIGRPGFIYRLTEIADSIFPKRYDELLMDILNEIEQKEGRKKIDEIFRWRKNRLLEERRRLLNHGTSFDDKIKGMAKILEDDGYLIELDEDRNSFYLKQYNCPLSQVAKEYKECCKYEIQLYRELLERDVHRNSCLSDGDNACIYVIPKTA